MRNIPELLGIPFARLKEVRDRNFNLKRENPTSANFEWMMKQILNGKEVSRYVMDSQGNYISTSRERTLEFKDQTPFYQAILNVQQRISIEGLAIFTRFKMSEHNRFINATVYVCTDNPYINDSKRLTSLSRFQINPEPRGSSRLRVDPSQYHLEDKLDNIVRLINPELFPSVAGRAYRIAFDFSFRRGPGNNIPDLDVKELLLNQP